jgi:hypothetical protein
MKLLSKMVAAVTLLATFSFAIGAEEPEFPSSVDDISAPITYGELMLVLTNEKGVAAFVFPAEIQDGVEYRYRYLPKGGKEETGNGKAFEKYRRVPGDKPGEMGVIDEGGRLFLKAGPLKVRWSYASKGKGYIYYNPKHIQVQIAGAKYFEKIDLSRFVHADHEQENKP